MSVLLFVEYLFLSRYYRLLYISIIPNCRITLPILHQYYDVSRDVENYILTGTSSKIRVQRLLNFLLVSLDTEKDYMKFCIVINSISLMTSLPYSMITGICVIKYFKIIINYQLINLKSENINYYYVY